MKRERDTQAERQRERERVSTNRIRKQRERQKHNQNQKTDREMRTAIQLLLYQNNFFSSSRTKTKSPAQANFRSPLPLKKWSSTLPSESWRLTPSAGPLVSKTNLLRTRTMTTQKIICCGPLKFRQPAVPSQSSRNQNQSRVAIRSFRR